MVKIKKRSGILILAILPLLSSFTLGKTATTCSKNDVWTGWLTRPNILNMSTFPEFPIRWDTKEALEMKRKAVENWNTSSLKRFNAQIESYNQKTEKQRCILENLRSSQSIGLTKYKKLYQGYILFSNKFYPELTKSYKKGFARYKEFDTWYKKESAKQPGMRSGGL